MKLDELTAGRVYVDTNVLYMYLRADPARHAFSADTEMESRSK